MENIADKIMAGFSVLTIAFVSWFGVSSHLYQKDAEKQACERVINTRDDYRVMWEETFSYFSEDDPIVVGLHETLNKRLPPYEPGSCPPVAARTFEP